jgi:hypothetical protein
MTFEAFMNVPTFRQLSRAGGAALLATNQTYRSDHAATARALLSGADAGTSGAPSDGLISSLTRAGVGVCGQSRDCLGGDGLAWLTQGVLSPAQAAQDIRAFAEKRPGSLALVVVLSLQPSADMDRRGDSLTPIALATARPAELFPTNGRMRTLTSDTTRFSGLVTNVDVAPTILRFFGAPIPSSMEGSPMRVTGDAAPFAVHRRELEQRHIRIAVQLAELAIVCVTGASIILLLVGIGRGHRPSAPAAAVWRFVVLCGAALPFPLAAGGLLPRLTYGWVAIWVVGWIILLAGAARAVPWRGPMAPLAFLGAVSLAYLAADLALGSHGLRVPLLGGTMFDGARFYGLPNAFESMLLAAGLYVAARFDPVRGAVLLFACGLLSGFPALGADVGGSLVLFVAAGLWWQLRTRGRLGLREVTTAAGVAVAGLAVVLVVSRVFAPSPTHVTRFVERSGSSLTSGLDEIGRRLSAGVRQVVDAPASLIPLLGLPGVLWAGLRDGPVARALAGVPPWREVLIVLVVSAGVAFLVNDTGMAAAAPAFLYAVAVLAWAALSVPTARPRKATGEDRLSVPAG